MESNIRNGEQKPEGKYLLNLSKTSVGVMDMGSSDVLQTKEGAWRVCRFKGESLGMRLFPGLTTIQVYGFFQGGREGELITCMSWVCCD